VLYTVLFYSFSSASIQTGAPYNGSGKIAPFYVVYGASWLSPQHCFADFDRACINFVHLLDMYIMYSLSIIIPKHLSFWTCSTSLLFI